MTGDQIRAFTSQYVHDLEAIEPLSTERRIGIWNLAAYLITCEAVLHPAFTPTHRDSLLQSVQTEVKNPLYTQDYPNGNE